MNAIYTWRTIKILETGKCRTFRRNPGEFCDEWG